MHAAPSSDHAPLGGAVHSSWFLPFPNVCGRSHSRNAVPFRNYGIGTVGSLIVQSFPSWEDGRWRYCDSCKTVSSLRRTSRGSWRPMKRLCELYIWSTEATRLPNWWRGKLSRSARAVCEIRRRFQGSQSRRSARRRNRRAICCRCDQGRVEGGVRVGEATNFRAFKAAQPRPTHHHAGRSSGGPFALQAPVTGSRAWPS